MILDADELTGGALPRVDVCVIGSGAGGAVAAKELAESGLRVALLESGPALARPEAAATARDDLALYARGGGAMNGDFSIRLLSGRALGGSTLLGDGVAARPPADVLTEWLADEGLAVPPAAFARRLRAIEKLLGVAPTRPTAINRNNALLREGARRLGIEPTVLRRAVTNAPAADAPSGACAPELRRSTLNAFIPLLDTYGAQVFAGAAVERIARDGAGGGWRVEARTRSGKAVGWIARAVVVAAGALATPRLLARSGLLPRTNPTLHLSPTALVAGRMNEAVQAHVGAPSTVELDAWTDWSDGNGPGVLVRGHGPHPSWLAPALGGLHGSEALGAFDHLMVVEVVLRDRSRGRIAADGAVDYALEESDARRLIQGIAGTAEVLFAAGARAVYTPIETLPRLGGASDLGKLRGHRAQSGGISLISTAPGGSCRAGPPERGGVVAGNFELRGAAGVYVMDASVLPSPVGVPPQLTIMALAAWGARGLARRLHGTGSMGS